MLVADGDQVKSNFSVNKMTDTSERDALGLDVFKIHIFFNLNYGLFDSFLLLMKLLSIALYCWVLWCLCHASQFLSRPLLRPGRGGRSSGQHKHRQGKITVASALNGDIDGCGSVEMFNFSYCQRWVATWLAWSCFKIFSSLLRFLWTTLVDGLWNLFGGFVFQPVPLWQSPFSVLNLFMLVCARGSLYV